MVIKFYDNPPPIKLPKTAIIRMMTIGRQIIQIPSRLAPRTAKIKPKGNKSVARAAIP